MVTFTDKAKEKVIGFMQGDLSSSPYLRIRISGKNMNGFVYQFFLEKAEDGRVEDVDFDMGKFKIRFKKTEQEDLQGSTVDWVDDMAGSGFKVTNPNSPLRHLKGTVAEKIQQLFETEINPSLASHGGSAEVVDLKEGGKLLVKMSGGCQGCGQAAATLRQGIEVRVKEVFPEIQEIVDVTDHDAGENPYFSH